MIAAQEFLYLYIAKEILISKQNDRFDITKQIVRVKLLLVCLPPPVPKLLKMYIARLSLTTEELFHDFLLAHVIDS